MRPLSPVIKTLFYQYVVWGRLRWLGKPVYKLILGAELVWHRIEDMFYPLDQSDVSDLTVVIKTFERPYALRRLVKSIRRRYPTLSILIADDSRQPTNLSLPGVEVLELPYDSGISVGRNVALERLQTPFFLLLDDDFVFSHRQRLGDYLDIMRQHEQIDILGGRTIDLPLYVQHDFHDMPIGSTTNQPKVPLGTLFSGHRVVAKVQNYFVGRRETVRLVKWEPRLKTSEHTEFFTRAQGHLTTVFHANMHILHARTPFDIGYAVKRHRTLHFQDSPEI